MATKLRDIRTKEIMSMLVERFSLAFSFNPSEVRPLDGEAFRDVQQHFQLYGREEKYLRRAFAQYQNSSAYLRSVALGKRERDILGRRSQTPMPQTRRDKARRSLQLRGHWTASLERLYQGHLRDTPKHLRPGLATPPSKGR